MRRAAGNTAKIRISLIVSRKRNQVKAAGRVAGM
jgi:hypothetical protein